MRRHEPRVKVIQKILHDLWRFYYRNLLKTPFFKKGENFPWKSAMTHGLLDTRPYILQTLNRVGPFGTIWNQTTLLSVFISMSRVRSDHFIFWGKLLGEIWAFLIKSLKANKLRITYGFSFFSVLYKDMYSMSTLNKF